MFKGFTPKLQTLITSHNSTRKSIMTDFIFNASDLNISWDKNPGEYKYDIADEELRRELGEIIINRGGSMVNPIALNLSNDYEKLPINCTVLEKGISPNIWIVIDTAWIKKTQAKNMSRTIKSSEKIGKGIRAFFTDDLLEKYLIKHDKRERERIEQAEAVARQNKSNEILVARQKALQEIKKLISENGLDLATTPIEWRTIFPLPQNCFCEVNGDASKNAKLWEKHLTYCLWKDPNHFVEFKNKMISAITKLTEGGKENLDNYKKQAIQKIIKFLSEKGISESEIETKDPSWKEFFLHEVSSFTKKDEIDNYQKQTQSYLERILKKKKAKNNNEGDAGSSQTDDTGNNTGTGNTGDNNNDNNNGGGPSEPKGPNDPNNQTNIKELKKQVIADIKNTLNNPKPKLTNSDLSSEYQNWETKLNNLTEENEIKAWKEKVLAHIEARRKEKQTSQKVEEDFQKTQDPNATPQEKKAALDDLDKNEGEKSYEEKKEQIKETKKEVARDNPNEYRNKLIANLDKKLAENGITENDLDDDAKQEIKNLKDNNVNLEPEKLVEIEMKLNEKIGQTGARKKINILASEVEEVLKKKDKVQIENLKKKLLEIINSSNVYYRVHKSQAEKLLKQLENIVISNKNNNSQPPKNSLSLTAKIWIGIGVIVLVVGIFALLIWIVKKRNHFKKVGLGQKIAKKKKKNIILTNNKIKLNS